MLTTNNKAMEQINKNLSIGIIGAGDIVSKVHLPVLSAMEGAAIRWITDIDSKKAYSLANAYKISYCELPRNLTELPYTDIVLLAIPYGARKPYYEVFRERTSALYVEKPFSLTQDEHKNLCSWFPPYKLCLGLQRRSWGPTLLIKKIIETNVYGELQAIRFGLGNPAGFVGLADFFSDISLSRGGILFDVGIHGIDTIFFCTNAKLFQINYLKMITEKGYDIHTKAEYTIQNSQNNNIKCEITVSSLQETINKIEFEFKDSVLSYSLFDLEGRINIKTLEDKTSETLSLTIDKDKTYPITTFQTFCEHWSHFINGINFKQANWTSASDSLLTTGLIESLYKEGSKQIQKLKT
ncbi:MAG: Gfo/Idh/MocA family oxidoreductase [Candidatus Melainabacteria bacterium]|nr:Gfo/Idh/MocA family oxidoreductase [Candidatus Melainabacteria bacterium]